MLSELELKKDFEALAEKYGIPKTGEQDLTSNYIILQCIYVSRRMGKYKTSEEIISDFTALDIAKILLQLRYSKGNFSIETRGVSQKYSNKTIVEVMEKSLIDKLGCYVEKGAGCMLLKKGAGGGFTGRGFVIEYPVGVESHPAGYFSDEELQLLISYEMEKFNDWKLTQGNKQRWEDGGKSRLPELGKVASMIDCYLPNDMKIVDKYNFIAEYMMDAGFLEHMSEDWKVLFNMKDKKGKVRVVKDWIKSKKV